jgi:hypothetical protein
MMKLRTKKPGFADYALKLNSKSSLKQNKSNFCIKGKRMDIPLNKSPRVSKPLRKTFGCTRSCFTTKTSDGQTHPCIDPSTIQFTFLTPNLSLLMGGCLPTDLASVILARSSTVFHASDHTLFSTHSCTIVFTVASTIRTFVAPLSESVSAEGVRVGSQVPPGVEAKAGEAEAEAEVPINAAGETGVGAECSKVSQRYLLRHAITDYEPP